MFILNQIIEEKKQKKKYNTDHEKTIRIGLNILHLPNSK